MRFITYQTPEGECIAVATDRGYFGLPVTAIKTDLLGLIAQGKEALQKTGGVLARGEAINLSNVTLSPPLPRPGKLICIGLNYADHSKESGFMPPEYPTVFARYTSSLVAASAPIIRPAVSDQLDYEGELAVIIGRSGRNISQENALAHVAGYSLFNDASVRDYQFKSPQWTMGKNFDSTGAFGPEFVTADELPPGCKGLKIETRLNGEVVQSASTSDMIFSVEQLVTTLSEVMTLDPGDVIVSGTPAGVGFARKPPLWMKPGDICEVEIERLGQLRNPII
jgi:acylpyruvate hydrolase